MHSEPPTTNDTTRTWRLAALIAAPVHLGFAWRFDWLCDDAYITFRYARHLAEGRGLVFNVGETPPVEGYSNLLWTLVLGAAHAVGLDIELMARLLSVGCGLALVAMTARVAATVLDARFVGTLAAALFVAASPTIAVWSTSGLETLPFAFVLFGLAARLWTASHKSSIACTFAWAASVVLLRADGFAWAAGVVAVGALGAWKREDAPARRTALVALAAIALTFAAHVAWRLGYHGSWLANTAHAKAGWSGMRLERGLNYVASFFLTSPLNALVPLAAFVARPRRFDVTIVAFGVLAMCIGVSVLVGGDFMAMGRFFAPSIAFIALLLAAIVDRVRPALLAGAVAIGCAALSAAPSYDAHLVPANVRERFHFRWNRPTPISEFAQWRAMDERAERWDEVARAMALHTRPGESMVMDAIGVVGYRTELHLFDCYGLVSPEVARRDAEPVRASPGHDLRVDVEFFFDQQPDYCGAVIARSGARPIDVVPRGLLEVPWASRLRVESFPLLAEDGFEPGTSLYMLRLDWSDAPR